MWNELVRNAIIIADFAGAEMHEYRMTEIL